MDVPFSKLVLVIIMAASCLAGSLFQALCDKLLTQVPGLHLWAASCHNGCAPTGWQVEYLTRPFRSPPAVIREVEQDGRMTSCLIKPYCERVVPDHTDGPPVRRVYHRGQGHSGDRPADCVTCGREVASFLHSLRVGVTENTTTSSTNVISTSDGTTAPCLQWRAVLVLYWDDVVWVAHGQRIRGVERKVVVCLNDADVDVRLHSMSRCTSQLVVICS